MIESRRLAHFTTIAEDGRPHTTIVWVGHDGDEIVIGKLMRDQKVAITERDPRVTFSMEADGEQWGMQFHLVVEGMVAEWNVLWETAQFRRREFDYDGLPPLIAKVADLGDNNVVLVPRTKSRYYEYAPLYHVLPRSTIERFGLPLVRAGQWPYMIGHGPRTDYLPPDFAHRLAQAWASHVWRHLTPGSPLTGFTKDDPIRLLAHNLDLWLPPVTEVVHDILRSFPSVEGDPHRTWPRTARRRVSA